MTILRSRNSSEEAHIIEYPVVRESLAAWERRVAEAEGRGKAAGLAEAQARIAAAEQRAAAAEQRAAATDARLKADYEKNLGQAISALHAAAAHLETLEHQLVTEAEADIARLALLVASRILRREVEDDPTWMDPVLADALARVPDKRGVAVRMHPDDAQVAGERKRLILESVPGLERLEFFPDDGLPRGACIIASQGTRLDASLPSTWERLSRELLADPRPTLEVPVLPPESRP
jgi:flagellar assembly protein FliH